MKSYPICVCFSWFEATSGTATRGRHRGTMGSAQCPLVAWCVFWRVRLGGIKLETTFWKCSLIYLAFSFQIAGVRQRSSVTSQPGRKPWHPFKRSPLENLQANSLAESGDLASVCQQGIVGLVARGIYSNTVLWFIFRLWQLSLANKTPRYLKFKLNSSWSSPLVKAGHGRY